MAFDNRLRPFTEAIASGRASQTKCEKHGGVGELRMSDLASEHSDGSFQLDGFGIRAPIFKAMRWSLIQYYDPIPLNSSCQVTSVRDALEMPSRCHLLAVRIPKLLLNP
jgi:hypothetical protein